MINDNSDCHKQPSLVQPRRLLRPTKHVLKRQTRTVLHQPVFVKTTTQVRQVVSRHGSQLQSSQPSSKIKSLIVVSSGFSEYAAMNQSRILSDVNHGLLSTPSRGAAMLKFLAKAKCRLHAGVKKNSPMACTMKPLACSPPPRWSNPNTAATRKQYRSC